MSYETNPILNRIKLSKGWKISSFPTKTLNYSRDLRVWFKIYLFLKVYLLLYGLRLLTYEVRISNSYTKCIYLAVTKLPKKTKKSTSKWKGNSFLKGLKSPLSSIYTKKGRFLLYLDLQTLKKKLFILFNSTQKKLLSRAWTTKPKKRSWINSSYFLLQRRKLAKLKYNLNWKKKVIFLSQYGADKKKRFSFVTPAKSSIFGQQNHVNKIFWKKKQRNLFSLLTKIQKDLFFFEMYFRSIWNQLILSKDMSLLALAIHLENYSKKRKLFLNQISRIYFLLKKTNTRDNKKRRNNTVGKRFQVSIKKKKTRLQYFYGWLLFMQQFRFFQKSSFFLSPPNQRLIFWNKRIFSNGNRVLPFKSQLKLWNYPFWVKKKTKSKIFRIVMLKSNTNLKQKKPQVKKTSLLRKITSCHSFAALIRKKEQNLSNQQVLSKTTFFQKPQKITFKQIFSWIRLAQKKQIVLKKTSAYRSSKRTKTLKKKQTFYRLSFRQNYRNFLTMTTQVKLKYLLQDLIKKYFDLTLDVKISWPLTQFKNLKFYRLLFPSYKFRVQNKKTFSLKMSKNKHLAKKKYLYIGQPTYHLKSNIFTSPTPYAQISMAGKNNTLSKKAVIFLPWKNKLKKKNKYLALKTKIINNKSAQRLSWASRAPFIAALLTTLTLFVKYLDPQPVADHLAKLIEKTKKHAEVLSLVESILRTFSLKRGLGYRIALIGRINGVNKSRTLYLRKLNRNRSRQNFSKQVNFAMAHARALIGTFAVKIWVYV